MGQSFARRLERDRYKTKKNNKSSMLIMKIFRSNKNIYAQIVDSLGNVRFSSSSISSELKKHGNLKDKTGIELSEIVGMELAKKIKSQNISNVVVDKSGYSFSGRIKKLVDSFFGQLNVGS